MADSIRDRRIAAPGTAEALLEPPVGLCVAAPWWGFEAVMAEAFVAERAQRREPASWHGYWAEIRRRAERAFRADQEPGAPER